MKIFDKLFGNSENVETVIAESRKQIEQNPTGHLPLSYRARLIRQIADESIIQKIYLECAKKVNIENDSSINEMLYKATEFLYRQKGDKKYFEEYADNNRNFYENQDNSRGLSGLTACWFAYSLAYGIEMEDYNGKDDDNAYDWQDWNPDFYASMVVSGGNPFIRLGNIDERKVFWNWYLECILTVLKNSNAPIISLNIEEKSEEDNPKASKRTQFSNTESIKNVINKIIEITIEDIDKQYSTTIYNKIEIRACCISVGSSVEMLYSDNNNDKKTIEFCRCWPDDRQTVLFNNIKEEMYKQNSKEGAWIECYLSVNKDNTFDISFNYDNLENFSKRAQSPEYLVVEFNAYPRSKEFTPKWWQRILGENAKYLN